LIKFPPLTALNTNHFSILLSPHVWFLFPSQRFMPNFSSGLLISFFFCFFGRNCFFVWCRLSFAFLSVSSHPPPFLSPQNVFFRSQSLFFHRPLFFSSLSIPIALLFRFSLRNFFSVLSYCSCSFLGTLSLTIEV